MSAFIFHVYISVVDDIEEAEIEGKLSHSSHFILKACTFQKTFVCLFLVSMFKHSMQCIQTSPVYKVHVLYPDHL